MLRTALAGLLLSFVARIECAEIATGPREVLVRVGGAIAQHSLEKLRAEVATLADLEAAVSGGVDALKPVQDPELILSHVSRLLGKARFINAETGIFERSVSIEGTDLIFDAIHLSGLVFETDRGQVKLVVDKLYFTKAGWKLAGSGSGTLPPADEVAKVRERATRRNADIAAVEKIGSGFHLLADGKLCTGLRIYTQPNEQALVGTLIEGYKRSRESKSGKVYYAVMLQARKDGHVIGVWKTPEQLKNMYFSAADLAIRNCAWSERDEEVDPLPDETPP